MERRLTLPIVVLISSIAACAFALQWFRDRHRIYTLNLATAGKSGQYYAFGQALAAVMADNSQIQVNVVETNGSRQNMQLLGQQQVDLAIIQSDVPIQPAVQAIAPLFPEMFHLIAAADSGIETVSDLQGKRVALMPQGSGSYHLFWPLSQHYGLSATDFEPVLLPPTAAQAALRR
ncbi:MAG: TAXI family TRAP transporter solute-binding subunit, partial [Cyanothece sp. SIO1E1]|nr:TAXI family TRAP transporter solute-binding subunit [Cyanothece sp. SIO1E1]